jgi:hypothetical protein
MSLTQPTSYYSQNSRACSFQKILHLCLLSATKGRELCPLAMRPQPFQLKEAANYGGLYPPDKL